MFQHCPRKSGLGDKGGWVSDDNRNINGEYSLAVSAGRWEVGYDLPVINGLKSQILLIESA